VAGHVNLVAALCCCTKIKKGRSHDRNRPLTYQSPLTESNRRPSPYHGDALPTELRGRVAWRWSFLADPARTKAEQLIRLPARSCQASIHDRKSLRVPEAGGW
jgi:hypothetical protein